MAVPGVTIVNAATTTPIASAVTTNTTIRLGPGAIISVLVTALNSNAMPFYDSAGAAAGTIVGIIPSNAGVGSVFIFNNPVVLGLVAGGNALNPGVTVTWI